MLASQSGEHEIAERKQKLIGRFLPEKSHTPRWEGGLPQGQPIER